MRWLFRFFVVFLLLWCGYWFAGSTLIERKAEEWFAAQGAAGRVASYQGIEVAGFPNRFDMTITAPELADPTRGLGWKAPAAKVYAMTWKPWHILAALPPTQELTLPGQTVTITSTELGASLRAKPDTALPLAEVRIVGQTLALRSTAGWEVEAAGMAAALRAAADQPATYDLGAELRDLRPDAGLLAALAAVNLPQMPAAPLPDMITRLHLDVRLPLTAPLDRFAATTPPELAAIELRDLSLQWGELTLVASGSLGPDSQGFAAGEIRLRATNWQHLPVLLVALGTLPERQASLITNMLRAVASDAGDTSTINIPLVLKDGWMNFGPLPLGPAPRLFALKS